MSEEMSHNEALLPDQLGTNVGPLTFALVNAVKELAARLEGLEGQRA